jgi:uncharacterized protein (TIGR02996 family)
MATPGVDDQDDFTSITGEWKRDIATRVDADTPVEQRFLLQLRDTPNDLEMRMVFADWLEERGFVNKAEVVRLLADPPIDGSEAMRLLRQASQYLPPDWLAIVSRSPIERCAVSFAFKCPLKWDALASTDAPTIRHCDRCDRQVHFCSSLDQVREHGAIGNCVAFSSALVRAQALDAYDEEIMMGEVADPGITDEIPTVTLDE